MEIKRIVEKLVVTKRRIVVRQSATAKQTTCPECGESMLTTEQAVTFVGIKQRRIFQIIETGAAHFTETEEGTVMICLESLSASLNGEVGRNRKRIIKESEKGTNEHKY